MTWTDLGVIFPVKNLSDWAYSHAYVPTAIALEDRIRVYVAFWSADRIGRLGYVDVDADEPRRILGHSNRPLLAPSPKGAFDEDGVTPMTIVRLQREIRLYYAGWRRGNGTIRYTLSTGLAVSRDGSSFERISHEPIIAPSNSSPTVRTLGAIFPHGGGWRCLLAEDVGQVNVNGKLTPSYRLSTMISPDGLRWPDIGEELFSVSPTVLGYGRSAVWKEAGRYLGLFSVRRYDGGYRAIEFAGSEDGRAWPPPSLEGMAFSADMTCDGQSEVCFPSILVRGDRKIMFYNGDSFGEAGLRVAVWHGSSAGFKVATS